MPKIKIIVLLVFIISCNTSDDTSSPDNQIVPDEALYFPPVNSNTWETESLSNLGWNSNALDELLNFLKDSNTEAFIVLKNGKIVVESYFNDASATTNNPWFSAGKTLTAFMVGIAQEENFLTINAPSHTYLENGWSSLTPEQENQILLKHHLSMTTGLDYTVDFACTDAECLTYLNPPNSFWYYHNAPYTLIQSIVSAAINTEFDSYYNSKLRDRIGMQGNWVSFRFNKFYVSNARSMARFGLLCLNKGTWEGTPILNNESYFEAMTSSSQTLNSAYGYLWWLNGTSSYKLPSSTETFTGELIPNAPEDLIAGLGANDQKLYVVPSENLVIVRMGQSANEEQLGPSGYDNLLWEKISELINQ